MPAPYPVARHTLPPAALEHADRIAAQAPPISDHTRHLLRTLLTTTNQAAAA